MAWNKIKNLYPSHCAVCGCALVRWTPVWFNHDAARGKRVRCLNCGAGSGVDNNGGAGMQAQDLDLVAPVAAAAALDVDAGGAAAGSGSGDLAAVIAAAVQRHLMPAAPAAVALDVEAVEKIVARMMQSRGVVRHEVVVPDMPAVGCDDKHFLFPTLVKLLALRQHVWLVGPAGSGKTTVVEQAAAACGLEFGSISVGEQTMLSQIVGYMSPAGTLVRSVFRDRYEHGGVFLLDEVDAGNANVLTAINSALANGQCAFPDGMVQRHKDFVCVAAGNTFGIGANRVYVGRCQIDGATRDRFAFLEFPYDEKLEEALCDNADWCARVRSVRAAVLKLGVRHVVSPRASISGARMLSAGFALADVENMVLWRGLDSDARSRVEESIA